MTVTRGKIQGGMDPLVCQYVTMHNLQEELERSYQTFLDINKAHVVMLAKQGIIKKDVAKRILEVNQEMASMGNVPNFEIDTALEDIYPNLEHYLVQKVGMAIGGQQHTARSRNDMTVTQERMDARKLYLQTCSLFLELTETILKLAKDNLKTVFAGYTCLQPSEPISIGHYLSAILSAMNRDYQRLESIWGKLNINPLGGCSMGSTTYPIDRNLTSKLLGFEAPMDNSLDSVAGLDYILELAAAMAIASNTFSRLCTDLYVWSTPEFGYIEVSDSVAACSSIMPQKKNPITLEFIRGSSAKLEALFVAVWGAMKNTPYTLVVDTYTVGASNLWQMFSVFESILKVLNLTIKTMTFHKDRMLKLAKENFCTVTELSNLLVRKEGISFREAHDLVAEVVRIMLKENKNSDKINTDVVNKAFKEMFHRETTLTEKDIKEALDPVRVAFSKNALGGPSPEEVKRQLEKLEASFEQNKKKLVLRCSSIEAAKQLLEREVSELL